MNSCVRPLPKADAQVYQLALLNGVLPGWKTEHRFHPSRRWAFDYAHVEKRIAIEVEGGVFIQGRHSRGLGMVKDMEKYNEATILGWRLLRYTPQQMRQGQYVEDIRRLNFS